MKIIVVGGHLTPALAVIEQLPKDTEIIFVGRKFVLEGDNSYSLEYKVISKLGIHFIPLTTGRIQRKFSKYSIISFLKMPYGLIQSMSIINKFKPDIVLSFGGYLSVPVGLAAYFKRIPVVIHEQTLKVGLANKFLSRIAVKICISWRQSESFFPKNKSVLTGNPIRKLQPSDSQISIPNANIPLIYITGGSAGAHALNLLIEGCLQNLLEKYLILHQTGDAKEFADFSRISELVKTLPIKLRKRYLIYKFINPTDIGQIMTRASMVISRSGINTVSEILRFGKLCLLIPLESGQLNEQLENARLVKKTGIGEYVSQKDLNSAKLLDLINEMLENKNKYLKHANYAKSLVNDQAASKIIKIIYEVISQR